jgi:hypothetical protein
MDQVGVTLGPPEVRGLHEHATKYRLAADELPQAERLPLGLVFMLAKEQFPRVDADQVLAVPPAVIVALID